MASVAQYVDELMAAYGKAGKDARDKFELSVGEVVLDLLLQNSSRFRRLERATTLTFVTGDDAEKLPSDFRSLKKPLTEREQDDKLIGPVEIVTDSEFIKRKGDAEYGGLIYAYIETRQTPTPGEYLVLNGEPTKTRYFKFQYYRRPSPSDADIIENEGLVKEGVRAKRKDMVGAEQAANSLTLYLAMKKSMIEHPGQRATGMALRPSRKQQQLNKLMHRIGRGR